MEDRIASIRDMRFISLSKGEVSEHSVEWVHSTGRNRWKGWQCAAGMHSLYIDFDGNIFTGTCGVGGWYGNVFRPGIDHGKRLNQWIECTADCCSCGADMYSPKVRKRELLPDHIDTIFSKIDNRSPDFNFKTTELV